MWGHQHSSVFRPKAESISKILNVKRFSKKVASYIESVRLFLRRVSNRFEKPITERLQEMLQIMVLVFTS